MNNPDLLYLYFSNSLTPEQENLFQKALESDPEFKKQFEFEKQLKEVIKSHETDRLKEELQDVERYLHKPKSTIFNYKNFAIAATIVLLLGWFGYNLLFSTNYTNLYDKNFSAYPNTVYSITRSNNEQSIEREAFLSYETKNYENAIRKFDMMPIEDQENYVFFYKAQAYLGMDYLPEAKALFSQTIEDNHDFVAESIWYLALIAIKEQDKTQAKTYLESLRNNYNYNKEKAQQLLKELN